MLQRTTEYAPVLASHEHAIAADSHRWDGITVPEIVRILRRRFAIIAITTAVLIVLAGIVVVAVRPLYTGTATILIDPRRPNVVNLDNNPGQIQSPQTDDA